MDDDRLTSIGLAAAGYAGGDPDAVAMMPVETVLDLVAYTAFQKNYARTRAHLNRPEAKN